MKKKRKNNKLHRAITHIKLDFANIGKLNQLDDLAESFMFLVQAYVDHIFDNNLKEASKFDEIPKIETNLSERYKRCAWQQAVGIMQSFFSNKRVNKPILKRIIIQGNANVIKIENSRTEEFDFWLKISTLEKGRPIRIPIKMHRYGNKIIKTGKLCSGVGLNFENGQWYATFVVETKNQKEKSQGSIVGVDLGIKNLLTTQAGHFGQFSQKLTDLVHKNDEKRRRKRFDPLTSIHYSSSALKCLFASISNHMANRVNWADAIKDSPSA